MIRHIVFVRLAAATPDADWDAVFADLAALKDAVPGVMAFTHGANASPEPLARGYTHAFTFDFADAAARDAYLVHPAHQAAGARLVRSTEGGVEGLVVIDIEI